MFRADLFSSLSHSFLKLYFTHKSFKKIFQNACPVLLYIVDDVHCYSLSYVKYCFLLIEIRQLPPPPLPLLLILLLLLLPLNLPLLLLFLPTHLLMCVVCLRVFVGTCIKRSEYRFGYCFLDAISMSYMLFFETRSFISLGFMMYIWKPGQGASWIRPSLPGFI